tara:strand:- start:1961 stop:2266 length:306 start_codon:yes stop_codon:yes gene_type:complete
MNIDFNKMGDNETLKVCKLIETAVNFGWDVSGYGEAGVNPNCGNVYIWNENEQYTLLIDLCNDLMACKTDHETGEEEIIEVNNMSWQDLENWAEQPILKVV